jgi:hypothetical protein
LSLIYPSSSVRSLCPARIGLSVQQRPENAIGRDSGQIWLVTDFDEGGDEPPEDVHDDSKYLSVPSKKELDLGRNLALRFADEALPNDYERVKGFFAKAGAYTRFKDLLDERGRLEDWYAYEKAGVQEALREWAADNEIEIEEGPHEKG